MLAAWCSMLSYLARVFVLTYSTRSVFCFRPLLEGAIKWIAGYHLTLLAPADTRGRPQLWLQAAKKCFPSSTFIMAKKTAIGIDLGGWVQTVRDKAVAAPKVCKVLWRCRFSVHFNK